VTHVGWGILGCGNIATHAIAPAIRWSHNGRLVAVASRDAATAARKARELVAERSYAPYEAMLEDPDIAAIYVGLPNGLHEEWAVRAAMAGKHVLCDKSLTLSETSTRRLSALFASKGLRLVEGFMYRHHPQWQIVERWMADRAIGEVQLVRASFSGVCPPGDHRWSPELGGGVLYDVACYTIDVARFVLGAEPTKVSAIGIEHANARSVERAIAATLEFPGGVLASVSGSLEAHHEEQLVIVGSRGRIEVDRPFVPGWAPTSVRLTREEGTIVFEAGGANHFLHQVEHFARLVQEPAVPSAPAEDGLSNAIVCSAVIESRRTGKAVTLEG
jgi:predicted dehydrogenase